MAAILAESFEHFLPCTLLPSPTQIILDISLLHLIDVLGTEVPHEEARSTAEFEHVTPLFLKIPRLTSVTKDFSLICLFMDPFLFDARSFLSY